MKKILILILGLSVSIWADFARDNSTNIVTDSNTGLQWQDDVNITKTWTQAIEYCETLTLGTHSDWRLPNFNELYSIADSTKRDPAMNNTFQKVVSKIYWSSTSVVGYEFNAWFVYFLDGTNDWTAKSKSRNVRCVRDGQ